VRYTGLRAVIVQELDCITISPFSPARIAAQTERCTLCGEIPRPATGARLR